MVRDIHRIGGSSIENLRLKPGETRMVPPGISVIRSPSPQEASQQMRMTYAATEAIQIGAAIIASTSAELIRSVGFDIIDKPSKKLPNHCRIIHPDGLAGFTDENLAKLSPSFTETTGY